MDGFCCTWCVLRSRTCVYSCHKVVTSQATDELLARLAQSVERQSHNLEVVSSILTLSSSFSFWKNFRTSAPSTTAIHIFVILQLRCLKLVAQHSLIHSHSPTSYTKTVHLLPSNLKMDTPPCVPSVQIIIFKHTSIFHLTCT